MPIYILGTGLSHDGSAVLLKDGKVCVAIEKERVTRKKHDGGNDTDAIQYCLAAEGITLADVKLVVQCANFDVPAPEQFHGKRLFDRTKPPQVVSISHHLAHAYSAAGTCSFDSCAIMVIDGCGSPIDQCMDISDANVLPDDFGATQAAYLCEKDSFYHFDGQRVTTLFKDFSPMDSPNDAGSFRMQTTRHSIGGFYAAVSHYVFGNLDDVGKLMGLAPYGKAGACTFPNPFAITDGRLFVTEDWKSELTRPSAGYDDFKAHFQYYADIALWAQQHVETAVEACFRARLERFPHDRVCYSGGVALNAVANARLLDENVVSELYMEPAAGDNGLALGCAFYGWLEVLKHEKVPHDGSTCFGKTYGDAEMDAAIRAGSAARLPGHGEFTVERLEETDLLRKTAELLDSGKTVGWFQGGSEFGPRALGHRSILAHPGIPGIGDHINANIKFREDFRPFAPAVLPKLAPMYFAAGRVSPYMILVDRTRPLYSTELQNVTHVNGTARVQTVDRNWNPRFYALLEHFYTVSGIGVLLNTSFNRRGMPIVETPAEAVELFAESALDVLVIGEYLVTK